MANSTPAKSYVLEVLTPVPPPAGARSSRWTAAPRKVGAYPSLASAKKGAAAYERKHGTQEGLRVSKGGRGVWSWYQFHGPLGHMDRSYVAGQVAHASDCPRCNAIRTAMDLLWPGMHPSKVRLTWEQKEALAGGAPCAQGSMERYTHMGWRI